MEILALRDSKTRNKTHLSPLDTAVATSTGVEIKYEAGQWVCVGKTSYNTLSTVFEYTWDENDWVVHRGNLSLEDLL